MKLYIILLFKAISIFKLKQYQSSNASIQVITYRALIIEIPNTLNNVNLDVKINKKWTKCHYGTCFLMVFYLSLCYNMRVLGGIYYAL